MFNTFKTQITAIYDATVEQQKKRELDKIEQGCKAEAEKRAKEEIKAREAAKKEAGEEYNFSTKHKDEETLKGLFLAEEKAKLTDEEKKVDVSSNPALMQYKVMMDVFLKFVESEANQNSDFNEALSYEWKSAERCLKFVYASAKKLACNNMCCVPADTVYDWIRDYYALDDKADVEREKAEAEERKKAAEERAKAEAEKEAKKKAEEQIKAKAEELAKAELAENGITEDSDEYKEKLAESKKVHLRKLRAEARKKAKAEEKAKAEREKAEAEAKSKEEKELPSQITEDTTLNTKPLSLNDVDVESGETFHSLVTFEDIFGLSHMMGR